MRRYDLFNTIAVYVVLLPLALGLLILGAWLGDLVFVAVGSLALVAFAHMVLTFESIPTPFNWNRRR